MKKTKILFFDSKKYDIDFFTKENENYDYSLKFVEAKLDENTAIMAKGYEVICVFVNDIVNKEVIKILAEGGTRLIALRCAGYNNVDYKEAKKYGLTIVRVPTYSPEAIAEATIAMLLTLNRKLTHAYNRVRDFNFSLQGLVGFNLRGKTIGIIGTGQIGRAFINVCRGFGMKMLAYDPYPQSISDVTYTSLDALIKNSDIISLHTPLTKDNYHLIDKKRIKDMKDGAIILNTSRGGLIDSNALLDGLKSKKLGGAALDVYEEEADVFYVDNSTEGIADDTLARLISMPNVLITSHQAYLTKEALEAISKTTLDNIKEFMEEKQLTNSCCD